MTDHFVADGEERLCRALELKFRSEVEREFAVQFARRLGDAMPWRETLY